MGGMALHEGQVAEMQTGEGKTLVATLPVYLNALTGLGVHLVTVNAYLAGRDADWYVAQPFLTLWKYALAELCASGNCLACLCAWSSAWKLSAVPVTAACVSFCL